jgi:hypothetical protein
VEELIITAENITYTKDNRYLYNGKEEQPMPGEVVGPESFREGQVL